MSDWSTGAVGAEHRAIMCNGQVQAIADTPGIASRIVRALNEEQRRARTAQTLVRMRDEIEKLAQYHLPLRGQLHAILRIGQEGQPS